MTNGYCYNFPCAYNRGTVATSHRVFNRSNGYRQGTMNFRLLEEAQHLSQVRAEPTYAAKDEPTNAMMGGSEAVISDILSMQDPRELTLSQVGERRTTLVEMRAGLPAGSFSPFDFDREFQARHGVRPEDANRLWHSHQSLRVIHNNKPP